MTEPTFEELTAEVETLRTLREELHGNLTKARARIKELEAARTTDGEEVERIRAEVLELKLTKPVAALLEDVLVQSKYSAMELAEHYKFELNEAGEIEMCDLEGKPVMTTEKVGDKQSSRPVRFEEEDVRRHLISTGKFDHIVIGSRASGGGASGSPYNPTPVARKEPSKQPGTGFGLK
ncbi:MAG: hypothetical protein ACRERX_02250 [Pseudomonas sp.]